MTLRLKYFFTAVSLALVLPFAVSATEKNPKGDEGNKQSKEAQEVKEDTLGIYDEENKVSDPFMLEDQQLISQEPISQERTVAAPQPKKSASNNPKQVEDDNSAMSFNFIYYIIDKFKLADPMD